MITIKCKFRFKEYSFQEIKPRCRKYEKSRWQIVANYEVIYFPGDPEACIEATPLKVVIAGYKNLKDAKRALYRRNTIKNTNVTFDTSEA